MTALMKKIKKKNNGTNVFRAAEKRNKHARVLTLRQAPSLKNGGIFVGPPHKKDYELCMLYNHSQ